MNDQLKEQIQQKIMEYNANVTSFGDLIDALYELTQDAFEAGKKQRTEEIKAAFNEELSKTREYSTEGGLALIEGQLIKVVFDHLSTTQDTEGKKE